MIKIAICDNEEKERKLLKDMIDEIMSGYSVPYKICEFAQGEELLGTELDFQLVFLDIIMDGKNGIDIGNAIYRRDRRIKIIFQTNYGQYCKDAMNRSHAFAYLEKPMTKPEVKSQIEEFMESGWDAEETRIEFKKVTLVRDGERETKQAVSLPVRDIIYFGYMKAQKSVRIVTGDSQYIYKAAMNAVEDKMKPFGFETSCRGILVNLGNVVKIQGYDVILKNGERVSLSQKRVQEFKMRMNDYIHNSMRR